MKALFLRWVHDRRGYMDENIIVVLFFNVLLTAAIIWLLDSGLMAHLRDALMGLLLSVLR